METQIDEPVMETGPEAETNAEPINNNQDIALNDDLLMDDTTDASNENNTKEGPQNDDEYVHNVPMEPSGYKLEKYFEENNKSQPTDVDKAQIIELEKTFHKNNVGVDQAKSILQDLSKVYGNNMAKYTEEFLKSSQECTERMQQVYGKNFETVNKSLVSYLKEHLQGKDLDTMKSVLATEPKLRKMFSDLVMGARRSNSFVKGAPIRVTSATDKLNAIIHNPENPDYKIWMNVNHKDHLKMNNYVDKLTAQSVREQEGYK